MVSEKRAAAEELDDIKCVILIRYMHVQVRQGVRTADLELMRAMMKDKRAAPEELDEIR
jgi:hypothetical protein